MSNSYSFDDTRLYISSSSMLLKQPVTAADFASVVWLEVKGLTTIGQVGGAYGTNVIEPLVGDAIKVKGSLDNGEMANVAMPYYDDAGQNKFRQAFADKCNYYGFKVEYGASCAPESTVTISVAGPAVVSWTAHGLQAGQPVVFTTTGALPTGLTAGSVYYVLAAGLTADTFTVSATSGGAAIETTAAGSGVHTATAASIGSTKLFQGLAVDTSEAGGGKNDNRSVNLTVAISGNVVTI